MSNGVHHPAVAKHDDVQRRVRSAALKHTLKVKKRLRFRVIHLIEFIQSNNFRHIYSIF